MHGTFNVAGAGVLMLSQALRRLGRPTVPLPGFLLDGLGSALKQAGLAAPSRELTDYLTFGRGLDTTRMRTMLGFTPAHTTEQAFADFARWVNPGLLPLPRHATQSQRAPIGTGVGHG